MTRFTDFSPEPDDSIFAHSVLRLVTQHRPDLKLDRATSEVLATRSIEQISDLTALAEYDARLA